MQFSSPAVSARLRRHSSAMARFGVVGVGNLVTEFAVFAALLHVGLPALAANACGFLGANSQSYVVNAHVTFRKDGAGAALSWSGYRRFFLAHCLSLAMSTAFILAFAGDVGPYAAKGAAVLFGFIANYAMSALFVFRERSPGDAAH
jgi:putative flippase GtrA